MLHKVLQVSICLRRFPSEPERAKTNVCFPHCMFHSRNPIDYLFCNSTEIQRKLLNRNGNKLRAGSLSSIPTIWIRFSQDYWINYENLHTQKAPGEFCSCGSDGKWKFMEIDFADFNVKREENVEMFEISCAALYGSFGVGWLCNVPKGKWYFTRKVPNANRSWRHNIYRSIIA